MEINAKNQQKLIDDGVIQIHYYMEEGDDKYGAVLFALYYEKTPFMLVKNYGRYYETYETFLTNLDILEQQVRPYMKSLAFNKVESKIESVDENTDIKDLEFVSGYNLNHYNTNNFKPKYEKGDIVWAWVTLKPYEDILNSDSLMMLKCAIVDVVSFNPSRSYKAKQLHRMFSYDMQQKKMRDLFLLDEKDNTHAAPTDLCDEFILGKCSDFPLPECAANHSFVDELGLDAPFKLLAENFQTYTFAQAMEVNKVLQLAQKIDSNLTPKTQTPKRKI